MKDHYYDILYSVFTREDIIKMNRELDVSGKKADNLNGEEAIEAADEWRRLKRAMNYMIESNARVLNGEKVADVEKEARGKIIDFRVGDIDSFE